MKILPLKALREDDFGHKLRQLSSFFSSDLDKFKLETHHHYLIIKWMSKFVSTRH